MVFDLPCADEVPPGREWVAVECADFAAGFLAWVEVWLVGFFAAAAWPDFDELVCAPDACAPPATGARMHVTATAQPKTDNVKRSLKVRPMVVPVEKLRKKFPQKRHYPARNQYHHHASLTTAMPVPAGFDVVTEVFPP